MYKIILLMMLFLLMGCTTWNRTDKLLMGSYLMFSTIDAVQSAQWDGEETYEINPIFANDDGTTNMKKLIAWKTTAGLGAYFISDKFLQIRRPLLIGINILQGGIVIWNLQY